MSSTCKSFINPHDTISVPKSGSIICDKAFNTSFSASTVNNVEASATNSTVRYAYQVVTGSINKKMNSITWR